MTKLSTNKTKTEEREKTIKELFTLQTEKDIRCGNGGSPQTYSHSVNCACKHLDPLIEMLKYNLNHE